MRIYTRTGDQGETGLIGGRRIAKTALRIEAVGHLDELNAAIGVCRTHAAPDLVSSALERLQSQLFDAGAELAVPPDRESSGPAVTGEHTARLEVEIDAMTGAMPPLASFVLPGGTPLAASLHVARTVCRRAERAVLRLHADQPVRDELRQYLNRLSDWLFTAARLANHSAGIADVTWSKQAE
jgi:cob(I)alamin adenosyltransferase